MTSDETGNRYTVADIDITKPNIARVYDCFLDGKDNFAADREFVGKALEAAPKAAMSAKNNRAFLRRAVQYLATEAGITQFLDLGSGLPTQGNVSEVVHAIDPTIHVVHGPGSVVLDAPVGTTLTLLPVGGRASGVTTAGLRYSLHGEPLEAGTTRGVSNVVEESGARVGLDGGTVLVVLPGDETLDGGQP